MKRKKIYVFLAALLFCSLFILKKDVNAADGTVYASVEKFTLGQGYLVEPTCVSLEKGDTFEDIFKKLMEENNMKANWNGNYLVSIDNADTGVLDIPDCIQTMPPSQNWDGTQVFPPTNENNAGNVEFPTLGEFAYSDQSGWYFFVNNEAPNVGFDGMKAKDGDVVRFQFTIYGLGADLGNRAPDALNLPDRDAMTKRLALIHSNQTACFVNSQCRTAYQNAVKVTANLDSTQGELDNAYAALPSEEQIAQYVDTYNTRVAQNLTDRINAIGDVTLDKEEMIRSIRNSYDALNDAQKAKISASTLQVLQKAEAKVLSLKNEKAAREEQALKAQKAQQQQKASAAAAAQQEAANAQKYTPAKVKLKSAKKTGTKKVKLTWKKVKGCSGYEIYVSNKKGAGYKKVANVKKWKKVSCIVKKGIKKKKTSYFKVRAYRKAAGKTYYGAFSNVKKVRMK